MGRAERKLAIPLKHSTIGPMHILQCAVRLPMAPMHRFVLILTVLGLLILTSCSAGAVTVENSTGRTIGSIDVEGTTATILSARGEVRGKVRGTVIRDASGKHVGTVDERDGHTVILDPEGSPLGTLENGTDCFGKGKEVLGSISTQVDASAAAAACLLFFLQ